MKAVNFITDHSEMQQKCIQYISIHIKGKSVNAKRFITTIKNKRYKFMASISKNAYIDKLDDIVNKYNNTYRTIKMKPVDVKPSACILTLIRRAIMLENNNKKIFLLKAVFQIDL